MNSAVSRKSSHIEKRALEIQKILDNEIPVGFVASSLNSFAQFIADKIGVTANALIRPGSHYRPLISDSFELQKRRTGSHGDELIEKSALRAKIHQHEVTISNLRQEVLTLNKILKSYPLQDASNTLEHKNYHAEFDATCRVLRDLLAHVSTLAITMKDNQIIDSGNSDLGLPPEVIVTGSDIRHFARWHHESK